MGDKALRYLFLPLLALLLVAGAAAPISLSGSLALGLPALVGLALLGVGYLYLRGTRPKVKGIIAVEGLRRPVEVIRDHFGIPHIYAQEAHDLFLALGYAMAQDRLWQMDLFRRAAWGRLAELFGPAAIEMDRYARTIGFGRAAETEVGLRDKETQEALEAFAAGVNAYITSHRRPWECALLRYRPEPWAQADSLAIGKMMGWFLSASLETALVAQQVADRYGPAALRQLFPSYPADAPVVVPSGGCGATARLGPEESPGPRLGWPWGSGASNSWVVGGRRSATGRPLLANDPHLQLAAPGPFYEAHLCGGGYNVTGALLPGGPGVVIGHNGHIAWGITNAGAVVSDLYLERLNPQNRRQYWRGDRWEEMTVRREEIKVRGRRPLVIEILATHHGPIVTPLFEGRPLPESLALRWVGQEHTQEATALLRLNRAQNWEGFTAALRFFHLPPLHFVYADAQGNIGYRLAGRIPIRRQCLLPVPGWEGEYEWPGYIPCEALPSLYNPPAGYIATANNPAGGENCPFVITWLCEPPYRIRRLTEILASFETFAPEDLARMQGDGLSPQARELCPALLRLVEPGAEGRMAEALNYLRRWDYQVAADSVAAAVFEVFYQKWLERALAEALDPALVAQVLELHQRNMGSIPWAGVDAALLEEQPGWLSAPRRDELVHASFVEAVAWLTHRLGSDVPRWRWGRLHTVTFAHPLGRLFPLGLLFNIGPFPQGGDSMTVCMARHLLTDPYATAMGPAYRIIVDLSDPDKSLACGVPGQSGHPISCHYRDQAPLWLKGHYHPLPFSRQAVEAHRAATLRLVPKRWGPSSSP